MSVLLTICSVIPVSETWQAGGLCQDICLNSNSIRKVEQFAEALRILKLLDEGHNHTQSKAFGCLLQKCMNMQALSEGKRIHCCIIRTNLSLSIFLENTLVTMYSKLGDYVHLLLVFERMVKRNVFTWTMLIVWYTKTGHDREVVHLFQLMQAEGLKPSSVTIVNLLFACTNAAIIEHAKLVHTQVLNSGRGLGVFVMNAFISFYAKCGNMEDASSIFDRIRSRNIVSWNNMIVGYIQNSQGLQALKVFRHMQQQVIKLNNITFVSALGACTIMAALEEGKKIHASLKKLGFDSDLYAGNSLVDMYAKCGCLTSAHQAFNCMPVRDIISWNVIIAGYVQHGNVKEAIRLFQYMQQECIMPNRITFINALNACADSIDLERGKRVHAFIELSEYTTDTFVGSTLICLYAKCSSIGEAWRIFGRFVTHDVVSWSAMVAGYVHNGDGKKALNLLVQMQGQGIKPNNVTFTSAVNACSILASSEWGKVVHSGIKKCGHGCDVLVGSALIDMYAKCGNIYDAYIVFQAMDKSDVITWTVMIAGLVQNGHCQGAMELFKAMRQERIYPDLITYVCMFNACSSIRALEQGKCLHAKIIIDTKYEEDVNVGSALVDMYGKCGSIDNAYHVFARLHTQDLVLWTTVIAGYAQLGGEQEVFKLFQSMQNEGIKPNKITLAIVLKACGNMVALDHGKQLHAYIKSEGLMFSSTLSNALIDMYAKCGSLEDACHVFNQQRSKTLVTWSSMLACYAQLGNGEGTLRLFQKMQQEGMIPDGIILVSVLSACNHAGLLNEGFHIFSSLCLHFDVVWEPDHYCCMVDLLGRAGYIDVAEEILNSMPFLLNMAIGMALLAACMDMV